MGKTLLSIKKELLDNGKDPPPTPKRPLSDLK
jgi:hypothetical protein